MGLAGWLPFLATVNYRSVIDGFLTLHCTFLASSLALLLLLLLLLLLPKMDRKMTPSVVVVTL
jgi:hypothetical protein